MIIEEITGDIVYQFKIGKYNIAHGCNCFNAMGAGLAGGDWDRIKNIINDVSKDFPITIVHFKNTPFFK